MKTLIIYYTLTENTTFFAKELAASLDGDVTMEEVATFRDMGRYGKLKFVIAAFQQLFKTEPALMPLENDPATFDRIFIGTPVWMGRHAPAINTLLSSCPFTGKKVALFGSCGAAKPADWLKSLRTRLTQDNEIIGELLLKDPEKTSIASAEKIVAWVKTLKSQN